LETKASKFRDEANEFVRIMIISKCIIKQA